MKERTSESSGSTEAGERFPWTIIYLSTVPWNFLHQRMHALCCELAGRGHEVYFVNPLYSKQGHKLSFNRSSLSFAIDPEAILLHEDYGVREIVFPRRLEFGRFKTKPPFVGYWIKKWLIYCLDNIVRSSDKPVIVIASSPVWSDIVLSLDRDFTAFDFIDDANILSEGIRDAEYARQEASLVDACDLILVTAGSLREHIGKNYPRARVIDLPNGVDFDWFVETARTSQTPEELKELPGPIVGFVGALYAWIDVPLLVRAARARPDISFVFVGYREKAEIFSKFIEMPNVHYFREKPYDQVPSWVNSFDVCIIPFADGAIAKSTDPKKIYEYLALGKPVIVSDNLLEMKKVGDLVYVSKGFDSFMECVNKALSEDDPGKVRARELFARENSWSARAGKLESLIKEKLSEVRHK